jgi:hypothetical protein
MIVITYITYKTVDVIQFHLSNLQSAEYLAEHSEVDIIWLAVHGKGDPPKATLEFRLL